MELSEYLNCICNRNSGATTREDKKKFSYITRRLFSAQYPIQCDMINGISSDPIADAYVVILLAMRYNGKPPFLNMKVDQKKKKESIRKFYEDCVIDKYMEINECGIREVELAYEFDKDSVDEAMKLIKNNFFANDKDKLIIEKNKASKPKEEKSLF